MTKRQNNKISRYLAGSDSTRILHYTFLPVVDVVPALYFMITRYLSSNRIEHLTDGVFDKLLNLERL